MNFKKKMIDKYEKSFMYDDGNMMKSNNHENDNLKKYVYTQEEIDDREIVSHLTLFEASNKQKRKGENLEDLNGKLIKRNYTRKNKHNNFRPPICELSKEDTKLRQLGASLFNITREEQMPTGTSSKFNCNKFVFKVKFNNESGKSIGDLTSEINEMFIQLHSDMLSLLDGKDQINVIINHQDFERPITFPFLNREKFIDINLENTFNSVTQSYRDININNARPLTFDICVARLPTGSGGRKKNFIFRDLTTYRLQSPFISEVENTNNLCAIYSVFVAIAEYELKLDRSNKKLLDATKKSYKKQIMCAKQSYAGLSNWSRYNNPLFMLATEFLVKKKLAKEKEYGLEIFPIIQAYFNNEYQITVVSTFIKLS
jgi:hypothetical protein